MRLEGRTALVTGGASGIGAATARRLAAEGARVAVGDLDLDGARSVAGEIDGLATELDVADTGSVGRAVAAVNDGLGPVDVLVNNAGTDRFAYFLNTDEALWDFVLGVNLRGVLACTHAVLGGMHERGGGTIVNVASEAGRGGSPGSGAHPAGEGRRHRLHEGDRARVGALRGALQRGGAGADRDAAAELGRGAARRSRRAPQ